MMHGGEKCAAYETLAVSVQQAITRDDAGLIDCTQVA